MVCCHDGYGYVLGSGCGSCVVVSKATCIFCYVVSSPFQLVFSIYFCALFYKWTAIVN